MVKYCSTCKHNANNDNQGVVARCMLNKPCVEYSQWTAIEFNGDLEKFKKLTNEMYELYELKNNNYDSAFSKSFKEFGLAMPSIRLSDKLERFKSLVKQGDSANCDDESMIDTLIDLANYSIMTIMEIERQRECGVVNE